MLEKIKEFLLKILKFIFPGLFEENINNNNNQEIIYKSKPLLTKCEIEFYNKLVKIEDCGNYKVIPQVNLASIIEKVSSNRYQSELYRNIDFGVFSKDLSKLFLLIELNDNTHNDQSRKIRDNKVKNICSNANIKLITFYTKYENKEEYIINRIKENVNDINN